MKRNHCVPFLIVLLVVACGQQSDEQLPKENHVAEHSSTVPDTVNIAINSVDDIQKAYFGISSIMESQRLDSTSFRYNCNGEKSGTVSYYTDNGNLKLMIHRYNEYDHYEVEDQYYIHEGEAFFVYRKSLSWSFDDGPEGATKDQITEQRTYVVKGKPIKCLEKKYELRKHKGINPNPESIVNQEKDCGQLKLPLGTFGQLQGYWKSAPPKCLEL